MGSIKIDGRCRKVTRIEIQAKRWFERTNGNTYHSVDVYANGVHVGSEPFAYGYDEQYMQTAHDILQRAGIYRKTVVYDTLHPQLQQMWRDVQQGEYWEFELDKRNNRDKFIINVEDVKRKKDLGGS